MTNTYDNGFGGKPWDRSLMDSLLAQRPPPPATDITVSPEIATFAREKLGPDPGLGYAIPFSVRVHEDARLPAGMWHEGLPFEIVQVVGDKVFGIGRRVLVHGPPREPK